MCGDRQSLTFMPKTHPVRRFCRTVLVSEKTEQRARDREASLRKGGGSGFARGNSGSFLSKPLFDWFILSAIIVSTVLLALDSPAYRVQNPSSATVRHRVGWFPGYESIA